MVTCLSYLVLAKKSFCDTSTFSVYSDMSNAPWRVVRSSRSVEVNRSGMQEARATTSLRNLVLEVEVIGNLVGGGRVVGGGMVGFVMLDSIDFF
jgi:hypothetical protein